MNESLRLNKTEIDTIVMGCAYNLASRTLNYNKARVLSASLGRTVNTPPAPPSDPNAESDGSEQRSASSRESLTKALSEVHSRCNTDLESFPQKLALAVGIQSRLLSALKSPTGTANVTFTADECAYVTEALRTFEDAEVEPITRAEIILAQVTFGFDGVSIDESARQTKEDFNANQSRRDDFICLMAKVITYGKTLDSSGVSKTPSDQ